MPRETTRSGVVYAKDGTLDGVSALAGYAYTKHHGRIAFAYMIAHRLSSPATRRIRTAIVTAISRY